MTRNQLESRIPVHLRRIGRVTVAGVKTQQRCDQGADDERQQQA